MEVLCRTWIAMGFGYREARAQVTLGVSLDKTGQKLVLSKSDFTLDNIEMTVEQKRFNKIIATRSTPPLAEEHGFLPGTEEEKMSPWMGAFHDNMDNLLRDEREGSSSWNDGATRQLIGSRVQIRRDEAAAKLWEPPHARGSCTSRTPLWRLKPLPPLKRQKGCSKASCGLPRAKHTIPRATSLARNPLSSSGFVLLKGNGTSRSPRPSTSLPRERIWSTTCPRA